jgi:lipopolysaccharide/colanic/teichoic acid biosynthesis glycosyltransferase
MRVIDIGLSLFGLIVLSPVMLIAALMVKCTSRGPVLYHALRVGKGGRLFHAHKFRSMVVDADRGPKVTGRGDSRVTPVGRFLRNKKIDELPQLFNALVGDMSLVGPRPEDPGYVRTYSSEQLRLLRVKPGLTGAATVLHHHEEELLGGPDWEASYRGEILPEKLRIELDYLSRRTLSKDLLILAQTASVLFAKPAPLDTNRSPQCRS